MLQHALDLLAPEPCAGCGADACNGSLMLCNDCTAEIGTRIHRLEVPEPLQNAWALGGYAGPLGALIRQAKYRPQPSLLDELGRRVVRGLFEVDGSWDMISWVPSAPSRQLKRGFDPAQLLARQIARGLDKPLVRLLKRTDATPQASRSDRERRGAIRGAYMSRSEVPPKTRLLLVDDVITTGATIATCADQLLCAGAWCVDGVSVAARDL